MKGMTKHVSELRLLLGCAVPYNPHTLAVSGTLTTPTCRCSAPALPCYATYHSHVCAVLVLVPHPRCMSTEMAVARSLKQARGDPGGGLYYTTAPGPMDWVSSLVAFNSSAFA